MHKSWQVSQPDAGYIDETGEAVCVIVMAGGDSPGFLQLAGCTP